jgi:hypothetical protein
MASTITSAFFATLHRFGNLFAVFFGIARHHFILVPRAADGDLAALAVEDLDLLADLLLDAVEHRDIVLRHAAVSAQQAAIRVGTDHGDGLDLLEIERREIVFVLEQRDRFMRRGKRQLAMLVAADHAVGLIGIDIGIVEQAHLELPEKHRRNQLVELRFLEHALLHQFDQMQVAIRIGQLDVDAGFDRERAGFLLVRATKWPCVSAGSRAPRWRSNRKRRSP